MKKKLQLLKVESCIKIKDNNNIHYFIIVEHILVQPCISVAKPMSLLTPLLEHFSGLSSVLIHIC